MWQYVDTTDYVAEVKQNLQGMKHRGSRLWYLHSMIEILSARNAMRRASKKFEQDLAAWRQRSQAGIKEARERFVAALADLHR